jgi:hypothetical protein
VVVWPEVEDELVAELRNAITELYGDDPKQSPDYGRVIYSRHSIASPSSSTTAPSPSAGTVRTRMSAPSLRPS